MKTCHEWGTEYSKRNTGWPTPDAEEWYNGGASEKEKQMLAFAEWYKVHHDDSNNGFLYYDNAEEAYAYWKAEVKGK